MYIYAPSSKEMDPTEQATRTPADSSQVQDTGTNANITTDIATTATTTVTTTATTTAIATDEADRHPLDRPLQSSVRQIRSNCALSPTNTRASHTETRRRFFAHESVNFNLATAPFVSRNIVAPPSSSVSSAPRSAHATENLEPTATGQDISRTTTSPNPALAQSNENLETSFTPLPALPSSYVAGHPPLHWASSLIANSNLYSSPLARPLLQHSQVHQAVHANSNVASPPSNALVSSLQTSTQGPISMHMPLPMSLPVQLQMPLPISTQTSTPMTMPVSMPVSMSLTTPTSIPVSQASPFTSFDRAMQRKRQRTSQQTSIEASASASTTTSDGDGEDDDESWETDFLW